MVHKRKAVSQEGRKDVPVFGSNPAYEFVRVAAMNGYALAELRLLVLLQLAENLIANLHTNFYREQILLASSTRLPTSSCAKRSATDAKTFRLS